MTILSALLGIAGIAMIIFGISQNNNMDAQLEAFFNTGTVNPGTPWIIIGSVCCVIAVGLVIFNYLNNNEKGSEKKIVVRSDSGAAKKCPRCGTANSADSNFCRKCGMDSRKVTKDAPAKPFVPAPRAKKTCVNCHGAIDQEVRTCPLCGKNSETYEAPATQESKPKGFSAPSDLD